MKIQLFHEAGHSGHVLQVARLPSPSDTAQSQLSHVSSSIGCSGLTEVTAQGHSSPSVSPPHVPVRSLVTQAL